MNLEPRDNVFILIEDLRKRHGQLQRDLRSRYTLRSPVYQTLVTDLETKIRELLTELETYLKLYNESTEYGSAPPGLELDLDEIDLLRSAMDLQYKDSPDDRIRWDLYKTICPVEARLWAVRNSYMVSVWEGEARVR